VKTLPIANCRLPIGMVTGGDGLNHVSNLVQWEKESAIGNWQSAIGNQVAQKEK
jgi:hypothetical protein